MLTQEEKEKRKEVRLTKEILRLLNFLNNNSFDEVHVNNHNYSIHIVRLIDSVIL